MTTMRFCLLNSNHIYHSLSNIYTNISQIGKSLLDIELGEMDRETVKGEHHFSQARLLYSLRPQAEILEKALGRDVPMRGDMIKLLKSQNPIHVVKNRI
jgi:hypothetical protein